MKINPHKTFVKNIILLGSCLKYNKTAKQLFINKSISVELNQVSVIVFVT